MVRLNVVACRWTGLLKVVSSKKAMVVFTDLFTGSYVQQIRKRKHNKPIIENRQLQLNTKIQACQLYLTIV